MLSGRASSSAQRRSERGKHVDEFREKQQWPDGVGDDQDGTHRVHELNNLGEPEEPGNLHHLGGRRRHSRQVWTKLDKELKGKYSKPTSFWKVKWHLPVVLEDCWMYRLHHNAKYTLWPNQTSRTKIQRNISIKKEKVKLKPDNRNFTSTEQKAVERNWRTEVKTFNKACLLHRQCIWRAPQVQSYRLSLVLLAGMVSDWPLFGVRGTVQRTSSSAGWQTWE